MCLKYVHIHSAFHLSYNMILNQIRSEDGDPEDLLRNSFYQFQSDRALPDLEVLFIFFSFIFGFLTLVGGCCGFQHLSTITFCLKLKLYFHGVLYELFISVVLQRQAKVLEQERDSIAIEDEEDVKDMYNLLQQYRSLKKDVRDIIFCPKYCLPFLQPGRLVSILLTKDFDNQPSSFLEESTTWGVIINFERIKGVEEGRYSNKV